MDDRERELPEDIVSEILARLPVETLVRYRSVCKSWQGLITSTSFINQHLNKSSSSSSSFIALLVHPGNNTVLSILITIDKACCLASIKQLYMPEDHGLDWKSSGVPTLLGCACGCCGVYCMAELFTDRAVIWNPAMRETRRVPLCTASIHDEKRLYYKFVAFSCSEDQSKKVRDFKLMRLLYSAHNAPPELQVYTMSTNAWTTTATSAHQGLEYGFVCKFLIEQPNGVVNLCNKAHWLVKFGETMVNVLLFFDFEKEYFGLIPVPRELIKSKMHRLFLTVFDSKFLCLVKREKRRRFHIWVLREHGDQEEQCTWVEHCVVYVGEKLGSNNYLHTWSPVADNDDHKGITGLYSHAEDIYLCRKSGFHRIQSGFNFETTELFNIFKNVSSLVSLHQ